MELLLNAASEGTPPDAEVTLSLFNPRLAHARCTGQRLRRRIRAEYLMERQGVSLSLANRAYCAIYPDLVRNQTKNR